MEVEDENESIKTGAKAKGNHCLGRAHEKTTKVLTFHRVARSRIFFNATITLLASFFVRPVTLVFR